ncbi:hypothetical protein HAP41_0000027475 [Bradyrhizobium barranii subsp. apii]|uniref:Uncharacterized protein n=1 Tax=Bradyrhizobium barranii subsp. apii TaxID=2819348 RepID=A0A8T5VA23_9BRAD|nr:hypothetical protein [Bradyrhizobium barranii]UPT84122.1 hypothetical protein HAP41_0000027475 [Bradyrhizobium barranii subsp. apii]UPU00523.1 hypothetical protein J4G48_0021970 [Bradyrhizobium barranii subsp. apii]
MKRILIGLIVAAVLAAGGWFGFNFYVQHRATSEVEAAFEQMRQQGGKASHGKITFELATRTLTIEDIAVTPGNLPQAQIKIAGIKGTGVRLVDDIRFSADSIDITGVEVALGHAPPAKLKVSYKIPQLTMRDYAGPVHAAAGPADNSPIEMYRYALSQYTGVTASSLTAPTLTMSFDSGNAAAGSGEFTYTGLAIQNLKHGKIDAMKADRAVISVEVKQPGKPDKLTGELSNIIVNDFDATAILAALDPQTSGDDNYRRVYRQVSAGPYTLKSAQAMRVDIDGFAIEDIAVQPSKFRLADVLAALPQDQSAPQTPAQARDLLEKIAGVYEGIRIGKAEMGKTSIGTPQGTAKINAVRYREGEFAVEGVDTPSPQGQFKMERFALKSFSITNLMRWAAGLSNPGQAPSPDQMLGLFRVLEGAEIKGVVSPFKNTRQLVTIDTISLNWGQLVGSIPSKANLVVKMVTPTDPSNPAQRPLIMAGVDKLAIDLDLGAAWTESSGAFALAPATIDLGNLAKAQARFALANVPRGLFTMTDPMEAMSEMAQVETGTLELSLRDSGVVDLVVAQFSRMQNVSRDAARSTIAEMIRAQGEKVTAANLDAKAAVDALAGFVETSGQTLTIKLTPLGKVPVLQLMDALNSEPIVALAQFRIEASTGL